MDMVTDLPVTKVKEDGSGAYDSIWVFVDRFTKAAHLAPCRKTCTAGTVAMLLFQNVYRLHGIPLEIVSDRDPRLMSDMWRELQRLLGTKLTPSTAFHPQTDGQTERTNRVVEEVLRHSVTLEQDTWDELLPAVELAINTTVKRATGMSPYMLAHGREAVLPFNMHLLPALRKNLTDAALEAAAEGGGTLTVPMSAADESKVPAARRLHGALAQMYNEARLALAVARNRQKLNTDPHRLDNSAAFDVGKKALLSTKHINLRLPIGGTKKLMPKYLGPFEIVQRVGPLAYRLKLPGNLRRCHDVFHVSQLHPWREGGRVQPPLPPESFELDGEVFWTIDKIVKHEHRIVGGRIKTFYTVRWQGFPPEQDTDEPAANLKHCTEPLDVYRQEVQAAGGTLDPPSELVERLAAQKAERATNAAARAAKRTSAGAARPSPLAPPEVVRTTRSGRQSKRSEPLNVHGGTPPAATANKRSKQT